MAQVGPTKRYRSVQVMHSRSSRWLFWLILAIVVGAVANLIFTMIVSGQLAEVVRLWMGSS